MQRAGFSAFWARGASRTAPPDANNLFTGKQVGEDSPVSRPEETIGYIVIEAGSGTIGPFSYVAAVGSDSVSGFGNSPPYTYNLPMQLPTPVAAIVMLQLDQPDCGTNKLSFDRADHNLFSMSLS